jgi:hypothetical protein
MKRSSHQQAEAELTKFGLTLPETAAGPAWKSTRALRVRGRLFFVFGEAWDLPVSPLDKQAEGLTLVMKLPVSAEMIQQLYFVRESRGWYKQHNWVIAHFDLEDDILAELKTLKGWMIQSYCAMAPKSLAKLVQAGS